MCTTSLDRRNRLAGNRNPERKVPYQHRLEPGRKSIYIAELNREQNEMNLVRYSALTGRRSRPFTETNEHYVEPQYPVLFLPNDPGKFIWQARKTDTTTCICMTPPAKQLKQLTQGEWVVTQVIGFDAKGENLFITSTQPHIRSSFNYGTPMNVNGWKLNLKKGRHPADTECRPGKCT